MGRLQKCWLVPFLSACYRPLGYIAFMNAFKVPVAYLQANYDV